MSLIFISSILSLKKAKLSFSKDVTTTGNKKIMIKFHKTEELKDTPETRKTSKVRPYAIPTVMHLHAK